MHSSHCCHPLDNNKYNADDRKYQFCVSIPVQESGPIAIAVALSVDHVAVPFFDHSLRRLVLDGAVPVDPVPPAR